MKGNKEKIGACHEKFENRVGAGAHVSTSGLAFLFFIDDRKVMLKFLIYSLSPSVFCLVHLLLMLGHI